MTWHAAKFRYSLYGIDQFKLVSAFSLNALNIN